MKIIHSVIAAILVADSLLLVGCASDNIQAEWTDPEFAGHSLRGEKVLIVCEANGEAVRRICQQQLTTRRSCGVVVVKLGGVELTPRTGGRGRCCGQGLPGRRQARAPSRMIRSGQAR